MNQTINRISGAVTDCCRLAPFLYRFARNKVAKQEQQSATLKLDFIEE
jgi:hypothetical protein